MLLNTSIASNVKSAINSIPQLKHFHIPLHRIANNMFSWL